MTFTSDLERLLRAATAAPWHYRYEGAQSFIEHDASPLAVVYENPDDAELIAFLRNHAGALLELIKAAEPFAKEYKLSNEDGAILLWWEQDVKLYGAIFEALAKLERV